MSFAEVCEERGLKRGKKLMRIDKGGEGKPDGKRDGEN